MQHPRQRLSADAFKALFEKRKAKYMNENINIDDFKFDETNNAINCTKCNTSIRDQRFRSLIIHVQAKKHIAKAKQDEDDVEMNVEDHTDDNNNNESIVTLLTQREKVMNNIRTVYYIAKKGLALSQYSSLVNLIHDCSGQVSSEHYNNNHAFGELLESLNSIQLHDDHTKLEKALRFAVSLDGNTIRTQTRVTLFARYYSQTIDKIEQVYQGLMDVKVRKYDANANIQDVLKTETGANLFKLLSSYIDEIPHGWEKLVGACTDHAKNMIGHKTGLQGRVKVENPIVLWIGCQAHSPNLWMEHSLRDSCDFYVEDETIVQKVYKIITGSYGRLNVYENFKQLFNTKHNSPKQIYQCRWNGAYAPYKVFCINIKSVIHAIKVISQYVVVRKRKTNVSSQLQQQLMQMEQNHPDIQLDEIPDKWLTFR